MSRKIAVVLKLDGPYKKDYGVFTGIREYADSHGDWDLELGNFFEYQIANGVRYDGMIGAISKEALDPAKEAGIPVVTVTHAYPKGQIHRVCTDYRAVGRMSAEHLIGRGLRRLAQFGYHGNRASELHYQGMLDAAREHGCACTRYSVSSILETSQDRWLRFVSYVKKASQSWDAPIGVSFIGDDLCRSVASVCISEGWRVPEQLAMVSAGNHEIICTSVEPTLSSVDMGHHHCGYEAARLLDRLMQGDPSTEEIIYTPPKELVVRHSSDVFAVSDPKVAEALRFMADNAGDRIAVLAIAAAVGLGRQSLERRFKQQVGRTINDELNRLRVETLKRLLVESDEPVKILSAEAGFGTTVNMHTMFKRVTGLTPTAYRKEHGS